MPDSYDGSWGDFSTQVVPDFGGAFNNSDYSNFFSGLGNTLGFTGNMFDDAQVNMGWNESRGEDQWGSGQKLSPEYLQQLQQLSYRPTQDENPTVNIRQGNKDLGDFRYGSSGGTMSKLMPSIVSGLVTGGFGAGLGGLFGGGALGSAAGNTLASGGMTAARGGNTSQIGSSMLSSGLGAGVGSFNPAGSMGLEGGLGKTVNAGIGGALSSAARGGNALQGGLSSMATTGLNSLGGNMASSFGDLWNSFSTPEESGMSFEYAQHDNDMSLGDYAQPEDVSFGLDQSLPTSEWSLPAQGMQRAAGFSSGDSGGNAFSFMPSNLGSSVSNYIGNNAGDLASMLYGFYNNKKQQKALQGQQQQAQNSLESLYGQNSPYATQLRNTLQAKAAAGGKRLNTSGRETQLQAMLADRSAQHQASLGPQMFQNQMAQGKLRSVGMNDALSFAKKTGLLDAAGQGLSKMFTPQPSLTGPGALQAYSNMDSMYSNMPWSE